jgi:hypothetical protein
MYAPIPRVDNEMCGFRIDGVLEHAEELANICPTFTFADAVITLHLRLVPRQQ